MKKRRVSLAGCALLITLASCGSTKSITTAAAPAASSPVSAAPSVAPSAAPAPVTTVAGAASVAPSVAPTAVPEILNFKTVKVGGGAIDGAEFAGKPTAFWFWAPT